MSHDIICNKGRCRKAEANYLDECLDCTLSEQIEHDLIKDQATF